MELFETDPSRKTLFAELLLPVPIPRLFTYRVPYNLNDYIRVGQRAIVQFGDRKVVTVRSPDEGAVYSAGDVRKLEIENLGYEAFTGTSAVLSANVDGQKGAPATWTSSDPKVAVIGGNGSVSFVGDGKVTFTATRGGKTATKTVGVSRNPAAKLVLRTVGRDVFPNDTISLRTEVWARGGQVVRNLRVNYAIVSSMPDAATAYVYA